MWAVTRALPLASESANMLVQKQRTCVKTTTLSKESGLRHKTDFTGSKIGAPVFSIRSSPCWAWMEAQKRLLIFKRVWPVFICYVMHCEEFVPQQKIVHRGCLITGAEAAFVASDVQAQMLTSSCAPAWCETPLMAPVAASHITVNSDVVSSLLCYFCPTMKYLLSSLTFGVSAVTSQQPC